MARVQENIKETMNIPLQPAENVMSTQTKLHYMEWQDWLIIILTSLIAAIMLFTNLGDKYLWQDEAATAVLGERMMKYGKPLAYDGKNLITMDFLIRQQDGQFIDHFTDDARTAIQYFIDRRDFKADTTWTGHPWGQFIVAGISLSLFGHNTIAARAPFAAAAVITVILLYLFIRKQFQDRWMALIAVFILLLNTYWILHSRQCRYYALTGLMLMITMMVYAYWQKGGRFGWGFFVLAAWCWFQVDFGSFWPVIGILLILAALHAWPRWIETVKVAIVLAITIAPWAWYYEIFGRLKTSFLPWHIKFVGNLFTINQFIIPIIFLIAAGLLLAYKWRKISPLLRQLILACLLIFPTSLLWVTSVAPWYFHRYYVHYTPLAALLMAWLFVEFGKWIGRDSKTLTLSVIVAFVISAIVVLCPLPSNLVAWMIPRKGMTLQLNPIGTLIRPELALLKDELLEHHIDPNRTVIELIKTKVQPNDEILVNYEDIPFMFYTDNPIRGGIPCFRVEDRSSTPRFLVIRKSVSFVYWPAFIREINRHNWKRIFVNAPDIMFGNNPEPDCQPDWILRWFSHKKKILPNLILAERISDVSAVDSRLPPLIER